MRVITAGESHGWGNIAVIEGFPKGVRIDEEFINKELCRRMAGYGRGKRMGVEQDAVEILSGLRGRITLGSPIALAVKNVDHRIFAQNIDDQPVLCVPRPAHADLAGALKYGETDMRNILERSSARETTAKVAVGAVCKQLLAYFNISFASYVVSIGSVSCAYKPKTAAEINNRVLNSKLYCLNPQDEIRMIREIDCAAKDKDSLGGVVEVWVDGLIAGIGSCMHYDKRLDAQLSLAMMSIPAVKGVEIGLGFEYASSRGSKVHDQIFYQRNKGYYHKTNNSGGIEGGMSNGNSIVLRIAMKPIATLMKPLISVNLKSKKTQKAIIERSDTCAVPACGVIAENMAALIVTQAFLEKFGCDTFTEIKAAYKRYQLTIK